MDATRDILFGKWHELKGLVRQQWSKLTDDDLTRISGKTEELVGILQQRYGFGKAQAEIEINNWLREHEREHPKVLRYVLKIHKKGRSTLANPRKQQSRVHNPDRK